MQPSEGVLGWGALPARATQPGTWGLCLALVEGRGGWASRSHIVFAVASALLSWACTSGSNKLKLARHSGEQKPQTEPWK